MAQNYKQIFARQQANKERWLRLNPKLADRTGIYILTRTDEMGIRYAYIGQAVKILTRLAQHLDGYQHIDLSIKKHGLATESPNGWCVAYRYCHKDELNDIERRYIEIYAQDGYQLRNKTAGGQDKGKVIIDEIRPTRTYRDGLAQGYKNAQRFVAGLFAKNLKAEIQGKDGANKQKAMEKFENFINIGEN